MVAKHIYNTVSGAGNLCWQIRISTSTVTISKSVVSLLLSPVTGAAASNSLCRRSVSSWPQQRKDKDDS
jgi:hypothetical protein